MAFLVVVTVGIQFHRILCVYARLLGKRTVRIINWECGIHIGHAFKDTCVNRMPVIEIGVDTFVNTQSTLPACLVSCE